MNRRTALQLIAGSSVLAATGAKTPAIKNFGALKPTNRDRVRFLSGPSFHDTFSPFRNVARDTRRNVFLYHSLLKELGEIEPHSQRGEGDCVGHAAAMGCDVLAAANIHDLRRREKWAAKASVEMIYAGSRVEIGGDQIRGDGSNGEWAAKWLKEYGVLHRLRYSDDGDSIDLSGYDAARSRQYRHAGVPDWLEPIARRHPIEEITNVRTGQEALDAVCARQPVLICSSYAFSSKRDSQGFTRPYTGWRRQQWFHAMVLTGAILEGDRVGGVIQNSHAAWNSGPRPYDMPEGSFAVDLEFLDWMVRDWFDCWAISSYKGHAAKRMRHRLYLR